MELYLTLNKFDNWAKDRVASVTKMPNDLNLFASELGSISNYVYITAEFPKRKGGLKKGFTNISSASVASYIPIADINPSCKIREPIVNIPGDILYTKKKLFNMYGKSKSSDNVVMDLYKDVPKVSLTKLDLKFIGSNLMKKSKGYYPFSRDLSFIKTIIPVEDGTLSIEQKGTEPFFRYVLRYNPQFLGTCILDDYILKASGLPSGAGYEGAISTASYLLGHELLHYRLDHFNPKKADSMFKIFFSKKGVPKETKELSRVAKDQIKLEVTYIKESMINSKLNKILKYGPCDSGIGPETTNFRSLNYSGMVGSCLAISEVVEDLQKVKVTFFLKKLAESSWSRGLSSLKEVVKDSHINRNSLILLFSHIPDYIDLVRCCSKYFSIIYSEDKYDLLMEGLPDFEDLDVVLDKNGKYNIVVDVERPDWTHPDGGKADLNSVKVYPLKGVIENKIISILKESPNKAVEVSNTNISGLISKEELSKLIDISSIQSIYPDGYYHHHIDYGKYLPLVLTQGSIVLRKDTKKLAVVVSVTDLDKDFNQTINIVNEKDFTDDIKTQVNNLLSNKSIILTPLEVRNISVDSSLLDTLTNKDVKLVIHNPPMIISGMGSMSMIKPEIDETDDPKTIDLTPSITILGDVKKGTEIGTDPSGSKEEIQKILNVSDVSDVDEVEKEIRDASARDEIAQILDSTDEEDKEFGKTAESTAEYNPDSLFSISGFSSEDKLSLVTLFNVVKKWSSKLAGETTKEEVEWDPSDASRKIKGAFGKEREIEIKLKDSSEKVLLTYFDTSGSMDAVLTSKVISAAINELLKRKAVTKILGLNFDGNILGAYADSDRTELLHSPKMAITKLPKFISIGTGSYQQRGFQSLKKLVTKSKIKIEEIHGGIFISDFEIFDSFLLPSFLTDSPFPWLLICVSPSITDVTFDKLTSLKQFLASNVSINKYLSWIVIGAGNKMNYNLKAIPKRKKNK